MIKKNGILSDIQDEDLELLAKNPVSFWEDVVKIEQEAFCNCYNLKEIEIPSSVEEIGAYAFFNTNVQKITIKEGLKIIGQDAFNGCEKLQEIEIPLSVEEIGDYAFSYCKNLQEIEIPSSVKKIGKQAFADTNLQKVTLKEGLKVIEKEAFYGCEKLKEIEIPSSVDKIGAHAFSYTNVQKITIKEGLKIIEDLAFYYDENLQEIEIPSSVEKIGVYAFSDTNLQKVTIKEGLKVIEQEAFYGCEKLQEIEIPSSVEKIGAHAFARSGLQKVTIKEGLKVIEKEAFYGCEKLQEIEIPSSVEKIGAHAFSDTNLQKVTIKEGLKVIEQEAFYNCENLEEIEIPSSVERIGEEAFKYTDLQKVTLKEGLKCIDEYAFEHCKNLKEIEIPSSVKKIGMEVFADTGLQKVILKEGLEVLEESAFNSCENLREIEVPGSVEKIGTSAFKNTGLQKVTLKEGLKSIDEYAFKHCENLQEIEIPSSVEKIGNDAFMKSGLQKVTLKEGLKVIGESAFSYCKNLQEIEIPSSVTTVGRWAFANTGLKKVFIKEGVQEIVPDAFVSSSKIEEIHLPKNIKLHDNSFEQLENAQKVYFYDMEVINNKWINYFLNNEADLYINDTTGEILLIDKERKDIDKGFRRYNELDEYLNNFNCPKQVAYALYKQNMSIEDLKKKHFQRDDKLLKINDENNIATFKDIYSVKEFSKMLKKIEAKIGYFENEEKFINKLYTFAYNLGAFSSDDKARQRACNFIENLFDKEILNEFKTIEYFKNMDIKGYNEEWTEFVMNKENTKRLMEIALTDNDFLSKTYNYFGKIKEFNRSNRGSQRYKMVTVDACVEYLSAAIFNHVSEKTVDIALTIKDYTRDQESFDTAVKIREEYLKRREKGEIKDHILNEELKEENIFESIEKVKQSVVNDAVSTLETLEDIASKKFTYEFLSKYDPRNFVLGKYCSCCAHLEGAGQGIMRTSILHETTQNLVIKDSTGKIIAKSTLYINKEQGYGVFNNVEISDAIKEEDKMLIYKKYKQAIKDFVKRYNELYKDKPLTQINVGMNHNDLGEIIKEMDKKGTILEGLDFSMIEGSRVSYKGDWQEEQYIMWKKQT